MGKAYMDVDASRRNNVHKLDWIHFYVPYHMEWCYSFLYSNLRTRYIYRKYPRWTVMDHKQRKPWDKNGYIQKRPFFSLSQQMSQWNFEFARQPSQQFVGIVLDCDVMWKRTRTYIYCIHEHRLMSLQFSPTSVVYYSCCHVDVGGSFLRKENHNPKSYAHENMKCVNDLHISFGVKQFNSENLFANDTKVKLVDTHICIR